MLTNFKLVFVTGIFLALCCTFTFAQESVSPQKQESVSPQKKTLILEYLELTGGEKAANEMFDLMSGMQVAETKKVLESMIDKDKMFSPVEKRKIKEEMRISAEQFSKRLREFFTERLDIGKLIQETTIPLLDKHFTESELMDLVAFYKSPTGQKTISLVPEMLMETMGMISEKVIPKMQEFMKEVTESELAMLKQKAKATAKKSAGKS